MIGPMLKRGDLIGGGYELAEWLGSGGNGEVWRAEDRRTGRMVAIKAFHEKTDPNYRNKLLRELFMQARFSEHEHILKLIDPLEEEGKLVLVLELADGGSAYDAIRGGSSGLPSEVVLAIVSQIARALAYVHEREAIHGDVKPMNILCVGGTWKLADMGTTKVVELASGRVTGDLTIGYAAPEMFSRKLYPQSDVYSLGCTAFELLTGRLPFPGLPAAIIGGHLHAEPPLDFILSPSWQEVVQRCMVKDPAGRWSAPELIEHLDGMSTSNVFVEPMTGMRFLWVPGGRFQMGAEDLKDAPQRWVTVAPFWLGETPVTHDQYRRFLEATGHGEPSYWNDERFSAPDRPVVGVSWHDAVAFCEWLKKQGGLAARLPSEAEWEYAARGTDGRKYPWGNEEPDETRACYSTDRPAPVVSYPAGQGPFGHLDLAGNVWEWCHDDVTQDFKEFAKALNASERRALRGGSWNFVTRWLRAACRNGFRPEYRLRNVGFRVAVSPPSPVEH